MRILLGAVLLCAACGGPGSGEEPDFHQQPAAFFSDPDSVLPGPGELRSSYSFEIDQGDHHSDHDFVARPHLGRHVDRTLRFRATFPPDAAYATQNPAHQSDWNKLMGLTTDRIHLNSIRIGWRFNPSTQKIELGFYGYLHGVRTMPMLTDVPLGVPVDCELHMTNQSLTARAGGASHTEQGSLGVSLPLTWVLHSAYFGGEETAPHDIHVEVSNIEVQ